MAICKDKKELTFSVAITGISGLLMLQAFNYPPESSGFPRFLTILMMFFSLILLMRSIKVCRASQSSRTCDTSGAGESFQTKKLTVPLVIFTATALYAVAIQYIGYFVSTTLFFLSTMTYFGKHRLWVSLFSSIAFMVVIYALFIKFLGLRMPDGLLF